MEKGSVIDAEQDLLMFSPEASVVEINGEPMYMRYADFMQTLSWKRQYLKIKAAFQELSRKRHITPEPPKHRYLGYL